MRKIKIKPNSFVKYFNKRQNGKFVVEEPKKVFGADYPLYVVSEHYFEKNWAEAKEQLSRCSTVRLKSYFHYLSALINYETHQYVQASRDIVKAIHLGITTPYSFYLAGVIFDKSSKTEEAIQFFHKSLALEPNPATYSNVALCYATLGDEKNARKAFNTSLRLGPNNPTILHNYGCFLTRVGDHGKAGQLLEQALDAHPHMLPTLSAYHYNELFSHEALAPNQERKLQSYTHAASKHYPESPGMRPLRPDGPMRIAYFSADFRRHSCAFFALPLIANHSPDTEVICFSITAPQDAITEQFKEACPQFFNCAGMKPTDIVKLIRSQNIDIFIDLMGHTSNQYIEVLLRRVAPIQISYLGFAQKTYLPTIDYRIVDHHTDPTDQTHTQGESLLRLPNSFLCFQDILKAPAIKPRVQGGHVIFGSFNNLSKISDENWQAWMLLLQKMPSSELVLKSPSRDAIGFEKKAAVFTKEFGIEPKRIRFLPRQDTYQGHLELYNTIDIALDTFPYNGTTTTCEALYMGKPVISLVGTEHRSRVGYSLLKNIGLDSLATSDFATYVNKALFLANNSDLRMTLSKSLRQRLENAPLTDAKAFARDFEQLLQETKHRHTVRHDKSPLAG